MNWTSLYMNGSPTTVSHGTANNIDPYSPTTSETSRTCTTTFNCSWVARTTSLAGCGSTAGRSASFLGIDASGRRVSFAEHVFYRFRASKIEHVWSLIDTDAIRRQLKQKA